MNDLSYIKPEFCDEQNLLDIMQVMRTKNIGPITFKRLYVQFKEPDKILAGLERILASKNKTYLLASRGSVEKELNSTRDYGANIISIFDQKYPKLLRECEDPPIIISYIGEIEKIPEQSIGFVGARNCSANGISLAYKYAKELADKNICVISGLAKGIDAASHKGALEADKYDEAIVPTVGVIGAGIDNIYPKENKDIFTRMARDGVIITEYPFGTKPKGENFPKRNRIISALSKGVLIVEATEKSGSLITARLAAEQNREVMCIPGFPLDERAKGCNKLIKDGAHIITDIKDIEDIIFATKAGQFDFALAQGEKTELNEGDFGLAFEANFLDEEDDEGESPVEGAASMSEVVEDQDIIQYVGFSPIEINEIIKISGMKASAVNSSILENEVEGNLIRLPGNKVTKRQKID